MTDEPRPQQVPAAEVPADVLLVDVREPEEWTAGHAPGAVHIPLGQLGARYTEIPQDARVYVICRAGSRSNQAAHALAGAGWAASPWPTWARCPAESRCCRCSPRVTPRRA